MAINVLIADQERTFAAAFATRLDDEGDMGVTGAVQVEALSSSLLPGKAAEVVLLDSDLPLRLREPPVRGTLRRQVDPVILLSFSSDPERIVKAFQVGAAAWVRKDESLEYLLRLIRGVARGESWLPPSETADVIRLLLRGGERHSESERLLANHSARACRPRVPSGRGRAP